MTTTLCRNFSRLYLSIGVQFTSVGGHFSFDKNIFLFNLKLTMAKGNDFENPTFEEDDYDDNIDDRLPMVPDETDQRIILNQIGAMDDVRGELRKSAVEAQKQNDLLKDSMMKQKSDTKWPRAR